tara:strand:+ start:128 stop:457 length:330 start_codon:yes stop_codon:yes gene_type:complete
MKAKNDRPIQEITIGRIRASIWLNRRKTGMPWYNVTASRSYKDEKGDWQDSQSFNYSDLPCVGKVLEDAMSWIRDQSALDVHEVVPGHAMDEGMKAKAPSVGRKKRGSK